MWKMLVVLCLAGCAPVSWAVRPAYVLPSNEYLSNGLSVEVQAVSQIVPNLQIAISSDSWETENGRLGDSISTFPLRVTVLGKFKTSPKSYATVGAGVTYMRAEYRMSYGTLKLLESIAIYNPSVDIPNAIAIHLEASVQGRPGPEDSNIVAGVFIRYTIADVSTHTTHDVGGPSTTANGTLDLTAIQLGFLVGGSF